MSNKKELTDRKRGLIFANLVISCIASSLLATALTTALPSIITDLHITVATGQWLTSGYSLAMGIMMPLTAFLITRFSTKKLYLFGLGIFAVGLALSAIAPTFPIMMASRMLQACGNGILSSMAQVVLLTIYPLEKRGTVMGWYGLSVSAAPVIAPTLAGIIVDSLGWHAIFYISIVIIAIAFIWAMFIFQDVLETSAKKFDMLSFLFSALAFGGITLGMGNLGTYGILSVHVVPALFIGIISGIIFVHRQLHQDEPFLELRILKNKNYTLSVVGSMLLYLVMMGSSILMPIYAQSILGYSATVSGLAVLPGSLAMTVICPFAGRLYDKIGMKPLFITGALCMLLSNFGMFFITMHTPIYVAALLNTLRSAAIGFLMMPLITWGTNSIHREMTAHGTALLTSLRTISGAIGAAVFVGIMTAIAKNSSSIHGLNISFMCMSGVTLVLLLIGILLVKGKTR